MQTISLTSTSQAFLPQDLRVVLLREHHENSYTDFAAQRIFNAAIIQRYYREGDIILVEEDAAKSANQLQLTQIPSLDRTQYHIAGWMPPVVANKLRAIEREERELDYAEALVKLPYVQNDNSSREVRLLAYKKLYHFSLKFNHHPEWHPVKWQDLNDSETTTFREAERDLLANYQLGRTCQSYKLATENFITMQTFCVRLIRHYHQNNAGRIFVVMGRNHGKTRFLKGLKLPYIAIDPFKQRAKINRQKSPKPQNSLKICGLFKRFLS